MREMSLLSPHRISSLQHLYWSFVFLKLFLRLPLSLISFSLLLLLFSSLLSQLIILLLRLLLHFSPTFQLILWRRNFLLNFSTLCI